MDQRKERLKPSQPFFVLGTEDFCQEVYLRQGISHFYTFRLTRDTKMTLVPDACVDYVFEFGQDTRTGYVAGTVLGYQEQEFRGNREYFGVRFLPGFKPVGLTVRLRELTDRSVAMGNALADESVFREVWEQKDFYQRIRVFLQRYTELEKTCAEAEAKEKIVEAVKMKAYQANGNIRIAELAEETGYSERYLNKIFLEYMGFSPKTFCKIIRFQRSLELLNYGASDKMTDVSVELGYYDQSQFIKDFKRFSGITPRQYLMLSRNRYVSMVHTVP